MPDDVQTDRGRRSSARMAVGNRVAKARITVVVRIRNKRDHATVQNRMAVAVGKIGHANDGQRAVRIVDVGVVGEEHRGLNGQRRVFIRGQRAEIGHHKIVVGDAVVVVVGEQARAVELRRVDRRELRTVRIARDVHHGSVCIHHDLEMNIARAEIDVVHAIQHGFDPIHKLRQDQVAVIGVEIVGAVVGPRGEVVVAAVDIAEDHADAVVGMRGAEAAGVWIDIDVNRIGRHGRRAETTRRLQKAGAGITSFASAVPVHDPVHRRIAEGYRAPSRQSGCR